MIDDAGQARSRAQLASLALRLVNEFAAEPLVRASDSGQTTARIALEPVPLKVSGGQLGRLYDAALIEVLDNGGRSELGQAVRRFGALGFSVSTVLTVQTQADTARVNDAIVAVHIDHLELDFAAAAATAGAPASPLLAAVVLPAARLWRVRAEAALAQQLLERKALAVIGLEAERGKTSCRLGAHDLAVGALGAEAARRLAQALRARGFSVEVLDAASPLRVRW